MGSRTKEMVSLGPYQKLHLSDDLIHLSTINFVDWEIHRATHEVPKRYQVWNDQKYISWNIAEDQRHGMT